MKIKMLRDGGGFVKGAVVDPREGIARTLVSIGAAEHVADEVDVEENVEPKRASSKPRRSKKAPKAGSE